MPGIALAILPALFAAAFAVASAAVAGVPNARKAALCATLDGGAKGALERYLADPGSVESRWLVLRVLGVAASAILFHRVLAPLGHWQLPAAVASVLLAYGIPAGVGIKLTQQLQEAAVPVALRLLRPFELLAAPLALPLDLFGHAASKLGSQSRPPSASLAESEVEILVNEGELNGSLAHDQSEMIRNVLDFGDVRAGDVMVPRTQVIGINEATEPAEILRIVAEHAHSRYPVYRDRIDNVVGILHVKDLINYAVSHDLKQLDISAVMRKPVVFVPETQSASSVLMDMRSGRRHHMAIIIDEFGGMSGVVTLEDLIEEIVGDIRDEHDDDEPPIVDLGGGRLMVDARVPIGDLSRYLGVDLPEDGAYNSLGGFLVDRLGQVPQVGVSVSENGLNFVVRDADERHVAKVEIVPQDPTPDSIPPQSSNRSAA